MFGYIKTLNPQLKVAEFETYRGVYCSLCQILGERYGFTARFTLSYDFTFLAILMMALREEKVTFQQGRCPFNPAKKRVMCHRVNHDALDFAADTAMLLAYHKLTDAIADERFFKRQKARVARWFVKRDYRRACKRRPDEARAVEEYMLAQAKIEQEQIASIDAAAEPTAIFLSTIACSMAPHVDEELMSRFGYCLGRFIYLADAADDMEDDLQSGNYNPYIKTAKEEIYDPKQLVTLRQYAAQSLHACMAVCAECYEQMNIYRFDGILRNIIYCGVPAVIKKIQSGDLKEKCHEESV